MKITKKQLEQLTLDWRKHNKAMKQKHMHDMVLASVDDYILYRKGQYFTKKSKIKTISKTYSPPAIVRRDESVEVRSLTDSGNLPKPCQELSKEKLSYSGEYIVGIATMHKSNIVPIGRGDDPESYAKMRR